jgi:sugar O-acyltransferase (sialic acid O-acetyltransferase NeuD family)
MKEGAGQPIHAPKALEGMKSIAIIGAGGNAREIAAIIRDLGCYEFLGYLVENNTGEHDSPVFGDLDWLRVNRVDCLAIGIGSPKAKLAMGREIAAEFPHTAWPILIHPTAYVGPTCKLHRGVIICVRAVVTENVHVEEFAQLNFASTVGHEARMGAGCLVNPGSNISGGVEIGEGTMVGTGAQILQYRKVGPNSIVGAGAVVTHDVAGDTTVVGVPAVERGRHR